MKIHIVRPGEQLWDLVQKYNVPLERVLEANPNIMEPEQLEVGSKVRIPSGRIPVSPLKRDHREEVTDPESFELTRPPEFELQPVVSRPESVEQTPSWDDVATQELQLILGNPIPMKEVDFREYEDEDESVDYADFDNESSGIGVDEWESSTMHSFKPDYASPFLPFYPTEPGFYPHPQLSYAPTMIHSGPPTCTDCGPSYPPQVAMAPPPYPFWTPYANPTFWQPEWYQQAPESAHVDWNDIYESSSAEF